MQLLVHTFSISTSAVLRLLFRSIDIAATHAYVPLPNVPVTAARIQLPHRYCGFSSYSNKFIISDTSATHHTS
ncbi:hypothetical protein DPMN_163537 [Dreissena polymorpha]|uniref:Uncharacterized protein n=1 Tax=Dreissena polymorpha TaxID=45954 RepID=A0A9D4EWY8_DREPO|nr:hypothetical protein DPMN_163537 [Dreissena polymorpha]